MRSIENISCTLLNILLSVLIYNASNCSTELKKPEIISLPFLNITDTSLDRGIQIIYRAEFYLVKNYKESKKSSQYIDEFVQMNMNKNFKLFHQYDMVFYKESAKTTKENLLEDRKLIDRHSNHHDRIFVYYWSNGQFLIKHKIKNGEIVEPKNKISINNISDSLINDR